MRLIVTDALTIRYNPFSPHGRDARVVYTHTVDLRCDSVFIVYRYTSTIQKSRLSWGHGLS